MRCKSFFVTLASLLVLSFGLANAGQIILESTDGSWDDLGTTKLIPDGPVQFNLRLINDDGQDNGAIANGFRIWTVGGGAFFPIVGDTLAGLGWEDMFDLVYKINYFSADGAGSDTVAFGGSKMMSTGLPDLFNQVCYFVITGGIAAGETLCLDSSYYPPTGSWMWAPSGAPSWSGQVCYLSEIPPNFPPEFTNCPTSLTFDHCLVAEYTFTADDVEHDDIEFRPVSGPGTVTAAGYWSYAPALVDVGASITLVVEVCDDAFDPSDHCNPVTCDVNLNFTNTGPSFTGQSCDTKTVSTNVEDVIVLTGSDDCDPISFSVVDGGGADVAYVDGPGSDVLHFMHGATGEFDVLLEVTDGDLTTQCTKHYSVLAGSMFQVGIGPNPECIGDQAGDFVFQGQHVMVPVWLNASAQEIGGYDLLIAYDASALAFQGAFIGDAFGPDGCGWEYFTYRYGPDGNCGNACPSGLLRVNAIAETNNGPNHPDCFLPGLPAIMFNIDFLVTNDRTFECQSVPIRFYWMDCGDNALSFSTGDTLYISNAVYDGYDPTNAWGNWMLNIANPTYGAYPTYFGAQDVDCFADSAQYPDKVPKRDVSFCNGCIFIACADSIDFRGDINLNMVPYEIADAVLYSNYFVYGLSVFSSDPVRREGQIAASDVNADGIPLSVADLVYLIRVVIGDANPYPKVSPVAATFTADGGELVVNSEMGAAFVIIEGYATPTLLAQNMVMEHAFDAENNSTRVLVFSMDEGETFNGHFLSAHGNVLSVEFATYEGAPVAAKLLPAAYRLDQNYPNPFNPTTTIGFALPIASEYNLTVYNVTGQRVNSFSGYAEAGDVVIEWDASEQASGIYFYKLTAGDFSDTKKMVLLK